MIMSVFRASKQGRAGKGEIKETKQRASHARWPLAASAVETTNHYLITSGTAVTDKNMQQTGDPDLLPDSQAPAICTNFPFPLVGTAFTWAVSL